VRIAVLAPMTVELEPVVEVLGLAEEASGEPPLHHGTVDGAEVVALLLGMGTRPAAENTERLLAATEVDHVVVVGVTGGVHPEAAIGDLVAPEVVIDGATGREHRPTHLGEVTPSGSMWTSDVLIRDQAELADLLRRGVIALDMETAAVAHVCDQRDVPWTVVRSVSDLPHDDSITDEVAALVQPDGTPDLDAVDRYLAEDPSRLEDLSRLGADMEVAAQAAAGGAAEVCRLLAASP